jgi:hypothetical protein
MMRLAKRCAEKDVYIDSLTKCTKMESKKVMITKDFEENLIASKQATII